jgi:hypothetical protein
MFSRLPTMLEDASRGASLLAGMAEGGGLRLDRESAERLARAEARASRWKLIWLAVAALSLAVIAVRPFL